MWDYQQPANPKLRQALIAEGPEFYLLLRLPAAVKETSKLNLDLSIRAAAPSICWENSQTNKADISIWNPRANADHSSSLMRVQR